MPINSNEKFLAAFKEFKEHYVLIGGTATSLILAQYDLKSRTTKDYDLVIIDDKKDKAFIRLWFVFFKRVVMHRLLWIKRGNFIDLLQLTPIIQRLLNFFVLYRIGFEVS